MSSQEFTVLYTHQKMKKSKTWQDGTLRMRPGGNKATLFDDKGQCLDSMFIKSQVNAGDNLESERYLITVEAVKVNEKPCEDQPRKAEIIEVNRNGVKPGILPSRHLSVGLKRKFTGFQGPRQVEKKTPTMEDEENPATSFVSKQCQGIFPSKFCITSPLFSTIGEKNAETKLSTDFHDDALTNNNRDHGSFSLVSPQFLDTCNEIEKRSSHQSIVKPEPPLITVHTKSYNQTTGRGAVSQNIRSTAQIIALLKSKTTQACREEATPEVNKPLSRFQAPENTNSLCNPKSTTLPAFSGNSDKRLAQNIQNLHSTKETVNDKKGWNAETRLHSSEPCDKEVTGQRHGEKANNLSQDLWDPCNTNSSFLSESTINRLHESQFVPSRSTSPTIFETHLSTHREHLLTTGLQENSSVKSESHLQPQQSSERVCRALEVSEDITLTESGIVKEEFSTRDKDCGQDEQVMQVNFNLLEAFDFSDTDDGDQCERNMKEIPEEDVLSKSPDSLERAVAQNTALRLHSCCEKEEIRCSTLDRESDGNACAAGVPLQLCDNKVRERERIVEDSANQTQITAEFLDERNNLTEMNENQLSQTELYIPPIALGQRDPRTSDCQPKSPGSGRLHEDDTNFIGEENFEKKSNFIKESIVDLSPLALNAHSEVPPWIMSGSPSCSDLGQMQWSSWEADKVISSVQLTSPVSPASGNKETVQDIQTPLMHRNLPSDSELSANVFTWEKHSYPEECSPARLKPTVKTRTPLVTVPATEKIPDVEFFLTDSEKSQQSSGSSAVSFSSKSAAFPISAPGPEDRNYETSVFGEYMEDRQRESVQPVFPNVTSHCRQSKWLKYQSSAQCDLITQNSDDVEVMDGICPESILGMLLGDTGESQSSSVNENAPGPAPLQTAKSMLGKCGAKSSSQDLISERKLLSLHLSQAPLGEPTQKVLNHLSCHTVTGDVQEITVSELSFPNVDKVKYANLPKRKIAIPIVFQSHVHYKQIFKAALTEHLNIMLFELSQRLHNALSKVDVSFYTSLKDGQSESKESSVLLCSHMRPAKLVTVKKEGQNKGRLFYACDAPRAERCSFFKWIEEVNPAQIKSRPSVVLHDIKSIGTYLRSQKISVFEGCQLLVRKAYEIQTQRCSKFKKFMNVHAKFDGDSKNKLYLKLSRKEHYSIYSKDDIWVVSKTLNFDPLDTFIACSAFFGPSSNNEVELLPLKGYYPSNWQSNISVHALLVCNASGELTSLRNLEEYFNPSALPLIPYLLKMNLDSEKPAKRVNKRKFTPPAMSLERTMMHGPVSTEVAMGLAEKMIETFSLNPDQAASLVQIAQMMTSRENIKSVEEHPIFPITIIRGVFGAGKSYLLSVVILFLVQLFESSEAEEGPRAVPWKLLIASSTNVAVDRILLGLLDLGFEDFIRVGSIRKITKAILPHSLHAGSGNENEQLKELLALLKEDLTPVEKIYVRKSIEQHKLGTNKTILQQVKVVGATCAACPFPCLNNLKFPVVMLDECSQMTEPASLLPIARFQCEKLVLVGDPKQLPPTIQGSESVHEKGLEQTLFDRLCLMGHKTIPLRTQYRCHPAISAIANELFYEGNLIDGVSEKERSPLLDWLPTLCFYSANGTEQTERDNSFYNMAEAHFTVKLIQSLIASGIEGSVIGVITLYKSQMCKIQNLLNSVHSEAFEIKAVQVSTVDAFQGAEKEIIVLSCVRTRQMGFIDSEKRMNVALTRAKRHLLIVGNLACLSKNRLWGRVIHHCKEWENGLQHVSQCEQQMNNILKCYLEEKEKEEKSKKKEK
ncbi:protein ZGRF1 [Aythya fuligula]|uniref:5'-3' DNA helicase ZGRF1 n=1 Tax=Aythya fuligula TaxID=219594 RepID=A0A6J3CVM0_AYTFU|nr:protein ZGRF1 [Aythya fuligula]